MPAPAAVQLETINKFLDGWGTNVPQNWVELWTEDCTNKILPFSLNAPLMDKVNVREKALPRLFSNLTNWKLQIYDIVHDVEKSKAAVYAISHADTPWGDFKWTNEYATFLHLTEDGKRIAKIEEMVDTAFWAEVNARAAAIAAEKAAAAANNPVAIPVATQ